MYPTHNWLLAQEHFRRVDRILFNTLLDLQKNNIQLSPIIEHPKEVRFEHLIESIVSQQLSVKASNTIYKRLLILVDNTVTPKTIIKADTEAMRTCGISYSKIKYIKGAAQAVIDKKISFDYMGFLTEDEIKQVLTSLKGIGPWSAEMFMMFTLGNPNIFSFGDGGLYNAFKKIYALDYKQKEQLEKAKTIIESWAPYKTYACKILWKSLDNEVKISY